MTNAERTQYIVDKLWRGNPIEHSVCVHVARDRSDWLYGFAPFTRLEDAFMVVEAMMPDWNWMSMTWTSSPRLWFCSFRKDDEVTSAQANSLPEAIALAAYRALGGKE